MRVLSGLDAEVHRAIDLNGSVGAVEYVREAEAALAAIA
jgi:hypothetical protein